MIYNSYNIGKIEKVKAKRSGTEYHKADLSQGANLYLGVAIFGGFEEQDLVVGGTLTGELNEKEYNGKPSYTLNPPEKPKTGQGGGYRTVQMEATMEKKNKAIAGFQSSKEESIKLAGAQRDAVLLTTTFSKDEPFFTEDEIKKKIVFWRDWLLSDDFNQTLPF